MEEKIIEARFRKNTLAWIVIIASIVAIVIGLIVEYHEYLTGYDYKTGLWSMEYLPNIEIYDSFGEYLEYSSNPFDNSPMFLVYGGILGILFGLFMILLMNSCAMTVTNSRVIGKASFGKRVDLPTTQISAVGLGWCGSIIVATSSGKIHFWLLANRDKVHAELAKVIQKVQVERTNTYGNVSVPNSADELRKYRELLDSGVITQEEFDAKKKQLLGL